MAVSKRGEESYARADVMLPADILEKARRELRRGKYHTPHRVAQRYGITISAAKKILEALVKEGVLVRYSGTRRTPIYLPKDRVPALKTLGVGVRAGEQR